MPFPTRVLFLIDELDIGGTEQQLFELVTRLDRRKYLPIVACFRPGRIAEEIEAAGVRVYRLRKRVKVDPGLVLALWRLMQRERIDLVQTYLFTANIWGRLAAILARVPIIVSSERNVDIWELRYKRLMATLLDRWTQGTIANSEAVKDYIVQKGLAPDKVAVIYNGVDTSRFSHPLQPGTMKAELRIPPHHSVVGFVARLEPQKDPDTFLRAAAHLAAKLPNVSFLVIGGGSLQRDLERQASRLGISERVIFTGPRRDVPRLLAACDVSVNASLKEGMANTILESMAAGKPVVATKVGGNAELIRDGETGFLVPSCNPVALALALQKLIEEPALAKAMGLRAQARVEKRFSVRAMVEATEQLYDALALTALDRSAVTMIKPPEAQGERPIAFVVSQFPRYADAYFLREITALAARGLQFYIFSLRGFRGQLIHEDAKRLLARTVYLPFFPPWRLLRAQARVLCRTPGRYLGALSAVIRGCWHHPFELIRGLAAFPKAVYFATLVRERRIAHVHANWATHPAVSALVMSRLTGVPWSFAGHASDIYLHRAMLADKIRAARFIVTCTRHNKDYLVGIGGADTSSKIVVCYHGVDLNKFRPAAKPASTHLRLLAVGKLATCKGFDDLITACKILAERGGAFECTIVGDGRERRTLERLIRRAGLADRIRITGYLAQEPLIRLYQEASVVVLPALSESHFGIPNVLLEALAVETPVVCTPLPSLAEVMEDGKQGLYMPERAPEALADALEALFRDPERCRAMGKAGRRQIEELFDTEKNVEVLAALLRPGISQPASKTEATPLSLGSAAKVFSRGSGSMAEPSTGDG